VPNTNLVSFRPPNRAGVLLPGLIYKHFTPTELKPSAVKRALGFLCQMSNVKGPTISFYTVSQLVDCSDRLLGIQNRWKASDVPTLHLGRKDLNHPPTAVGGILAFLCKAGEVIQRASS